MVLFPRKLSASGLLTLLAAFLFSFVLFGQMDAGVPAETKGGKFGVIRGVVRDKSGNPISNATVAVFRVGTSKLFKQVTATRSGKFFARIIPGTYTILAVAQGFNPVTLKGVRVNRSAELIYGFNLERAGRGNTLPEKRIDRKSARTAIRSAQRSIYQAGEGNIPAARDGDAVAAGSVEKSIGVLDEEDRTGRKSRTVVETYFASNSRGSYAGVNFATLRPLGRNAEIIFAGQAGSNDAAPSRFETSFNFRPNRDHQVRLRGSVSSFGDVLLNERRERLGQVSFQALDQWKVREGVIVVFGVDYSRFVGAGDDYAISPRLGFQFDLDARTRVRTSYTTHSEPRTWQRVIELESSQVLFHEPVAIEDVLVENERPKMNRSSRLEFGIERVLDNRSTVEANVFFDTVASRGVGLENLPFDTLGPAGFDDFVANQHGKAQGVRFVYNRRLNSIFSTSAGYAFGKGQRLSTEAITNPANVFQNSAFQTVFGRLSADIRTGTSIKTIFRLSPQATVFAIDPFRGRLAIYDPSLSVMVTQNLPSWGLPIDAEAVLDARNLFDYQTGAAGDEGAVLLSTQGRTLRGGILVRF